MNKAVVSPFLAASGLLLSFLVVVQLSVYFSPQPSVMPDELTYQRFVYYFDNLNAGIGTPIYSFAYDWTSRCSDGWYQCVKAFNLFWDLVFATALAAVAQKLTKSLSVSVIVAITVWFGPFTMYGMSFMPESMLSALIALSLASLVLLRDRPKSSGLVSGMFLGFAMLVKPHAFFVFIGFFVLTLAFFIRRGTSQNHDLVSSLGILLLTSITVRSVIAVVTFGPPGLNPLAGYLSAVTEPVAIAPTNSSSITGASPGLTSIQEASVSFIVNLAPGMIVLSFSLLAIQVAVGMSLREILKDRFFVYSATTLASLVFMAAAFGAFLELRAAEKTIFRLLTRYWEYSAAFVLVAAIVLIASRDLVKVTRLPIGLILVFSFFSFVLLLVPNSQTQADTSLLFPSVLPLVILTWLALFSLVLGRKWLQPIAAVVIVSIFGVGAGASSSLGILNAQNQEKAGVAAGRELAELLKQRPDDANRIVFVGERTAATTAAFIARLGEAQIVAGPEYYGRFDYKEIPGKPRWVLASKESFVLGDPISQRVYGDGVLYEFGYPFELKPVDFERFEIASEGEFLSTYWGSWVVGNEFNFTVPEDMFGDTVEISLLLNDELTDPRVSIDFGDGPIQGEIEMGQIMTPVTLSAPSGTDWAGKTIKVRYLGEQPSVDQSDKGLALGFGGFRVFNAVQ